MFWEECIKKGWIKEGTYNKYDLFHPIIETTQLSLGELNTLLRYAYKRFYIRLQKLAEEYIRELAAFVDGRLKEVYNAAPNVTPVKATILAALDIADELFKMKNEQEQITKNIEEKTKTLASLFE